MNDDMLDTLFDELPPNPIAVIPQTNGMVIITIGDSAAQGTWMDAVKLSQRLLTASMLSAKEIGVEEDVFLTTFLTV